MMLPSKGNIYDLFPFFLSFSVSYFGCRDGPFSMRSVYWMLWSLVVLVLVLLYTAIESIRYTTFRLYMLCFMCFAWHLSLLYYARIYLNCGRFRTRFTKDTLSPFLMTPATNIQTLFLILSLVFVCAYSS